MDNTVLNLGAGGDTIATKDVNGVKHELVVLEFGDGAGGVTEVSAADRLPVDTGINVAGLATSANQTTEIAGLAAILAKISSDPATQTTLAAILAKIIAAPSTEAKQDNEITQLTNLNAKDFATQTTLAAILAKIIAAPSTEAKQDTIITALNSIDAGTAAALGQAVMASSVPVTIASNQSAISTNATLQAETTKVIGTVNISAAQTIAAVTAITNALPAGNNNIGDVDIATIPALVAGSALIGKVGIDQTTPGTTNAVAVQLQTASGWSTNHLVSAASTNATVVKASAGQVGGWYIYNNNASPRKVAFHNTASTPTAGTGVVASLVIPGLSAANVLAGGVGIQFTTGIAFTTVTGLADNDTAAVAANDLILNIYFN